MEAILCVIVAALTIVSLLAYAILTNTLVVYCYYKWFLMPFFPVQEISFQLALALTFILMLLSHSDNIKLKYKENVTWVFFSEPWIILLVGWLIKLIFLNNIT
jgi:hypothetical protein